MRTSPQLSSSITFLHEWIFPGFFLLGLPLWILNALRGHIVEWILAVGWGIACIFVLVWSWPVKVVTIEGDCFIVSNYFTNHRIPIAHLANVTENYSSRSPTISLYFEPPTPFGRRVRIIPPTGFFNNDGFDEAVTFLRGLLNEHERSGAKMRVS